jgi:hypothetical protein
MSGAAMVSTADLGARLGDPGLVVVDVRSMAAYNGWRLRARRAADTFRAPSPSRASG